MTIGQRIASKRKELALSQEALGGQLGVSRQAIYKWESDAALPEIDKLIALARLYGVSVGWLLGVEEAPAEAPLPENGPGELSEAQMALAEQVAAAYLSRLPTPTGRLYRRFGAAIGALVAAGATLALALTLFAGQTAELLDRYQGLHSQMNSALNHQMDLLSNRVDTILQTQNHITASHSVELTASDCGSNTLDFLVQATPKQDQSGLEVLFLASSEHGALEFPGLRGADGVFSASLTVPLADDLTLSAIFLYPDGTRQTQPLETRQGLFRESLSSNWVDAEDALFYLDAEPLSPTESRITLENGVVHASKEFYEAISPHPNCQAAIGVSMRVGLFLNKQLIGWAEPCGKPPEAEDPQNTRAYYRLPDCTFTMTADDRLCVAGLTTDNFGRTYFSEYTEYRLGETFRRDGLCLHPNGSGDWDWDPAHWTF